MNLKLLIGGVLGGLVLFGLGFLVYGVIMADSMSGMPCMKTEETMSIPMIIVGNLLSGFLLAYIYSRWANISTFGGGAMAAAVIGLLMYGSFDCLMYGTTTMFTNVSGILMDVVMGTVMFAIAGGVIGWWMGRK